MANDEHVKILKEGIESWSAWRNMHPEIRPDLSRADLSRADLSGADLRYADLRYANLSYAILNDANLSGADLSGANLNETNFSNADLREADLSNARTWNTNFGNVDLRHVKGLERITHNGPSHLSTSTLVRSQAEIPEVFLRGVGLDDTFIAYVQALVSKPIQYYTCFISYASENEAFAKLLYDTLQGKGVRCWYAPHSLRPGDFIRRSIDEAIRMYDKLILILSEASVTSTWVEFEVEAALAKETADGPAVLFPIRIDETVMRSTSHWAVHIKRTRHIGNFTHWKDHDSYQRAFPILLQALQAEHKA